MRGLKGALAAALLTALVISLITAPQPNRLLSQGSTYSAWTPVDAGIDEVYTIGEHFGKLYTDLVEPPWYSDAAAVADAAGTVITAWVRRDVDLAGNDYVYVGFFRPEDTDGDGYPDAYAKVVKYVARAGTVRGVESVSSDGAYALITWTYVSTYGRDSVAAAVVSLNNLSVVWSGDVASSDTYYNEFSCSCRLGNYFLVAWYSSDGYVYASLVGPSGPSGQPAQIASTNGLYWRRADQMLCVSGSSKALLVYRKYDSNEGQPDLYASLIDTSLAATEVKLYDYDGSEETPGVRGAYLSVSGTGYFIIPFLSGSYVGYSVIRESDASVIRESTYPGQGTHPYIMGAGDRAVMAWVGSDGSIKVGNIDTTNWYIHITSWSDTAYAYHPIIVYDPAAGEYAVAYTGGEAQNDTDVRVAILSAGSATDTPSLLSGYPATLVGGPGNQSLTGLAGVGVNELTAIYVDHGTGERNLMAFVTAPDASPMPSATIYRLPADSEAYKQAVIDLIGAADEEILIAMAFWDEGPDPCSTEGTIANALVTKHQSAPGVGIYVIVDNDTDPDLKTCLADAGINVTDDSSVTGYHIMHNKFMVVDREYLLVATVNFITRDFSLNNNTAVIMNNTAAATYYRREFMQMWGGAFGTAKTEDNSFIAFTDYGGRAVVLEGYFTPQYYGVRTRVPDVVHAYIARASSSVRFTAYIFTTSYFVKPVYDAIVNASAKGADVKGVFDELLNVDTPGRRLYWFIDAGVPIAIDNHPYTMHAKLFTVDDEVAIIGSWNPTYSGTANNDENILVIRDPDTSSGLARQVAAYIEAMYSDTQHFVQPPHHYTPTHPVITKVMYYPDTSGDPRLEWVEIYNPTDTAYDLTWVVIGDADNFIDGDDEGMYKFPDGSSLGPHEYAVIAYDAQAFESAYGFPPTYEIAGTDPDVPDMVPYDTSKFTGSWNLSDDGDEVVLAYSSYGFLKVLDAVWYGSSQYMNGTYGQPASAAPLNTSIAQPGDGIVHKYVDGSITYLDALLLQDKYALEANPEPVPEPWLVAVAVLAAVAVAVVVRR